MNKRFTKKLRAQFLIDTTLAIYKTFMGYWVGDEVLDWRQYPDNYYKSGEEAIQAALAGERPNKIEIYYGNNSTVEGEAITLEVQDLRHPREGVSDVGNR